MLNHMISYDFSENILFKKYGENDDDFCHNGILINDKNDSVKLIEISINDILRIWNFFFLENY